MITHRVCLRFCYPWLTRHQTKPIEMQKMMAAETPRDASRCPPNGEKMVDFTSQNGGFHEPKCGFCQGKWWFWLQKNVGFRHMWNIFIFGSCPSSGISDSTSIYSPFTWNLNGVPVTMILTKDMAQLFGAMYHVGFEDGPQFQWIINVFPRNLAINCAIGSMYAIYGNIYHQYIPYMDPMCHKLQPYCAVISGVSPSNCSPADPASCWELALATSCWAATWTWRLRMR